MQHRGHARLSSRREQLWSEPSRLKGRLKMSSMLTLGQAWLTEWRMSEMQPDSFQSQNNLPVAVLRMVTPAVAIRALALRCRRCPRRLLSHHRCRRLSVLRRIWSRRSRRQMQLQEYWVQLGLGAPIEGFSRSCSTACAQSLGGGLTSASVRHMAATGRKCGQYATSMKSAMYLAVAAFIAPWASCGPGWKPPETMPGSLQPLPTRHILILCLQTRRLQQERN